MTSLCWKRHWSRAACVSAHIIVYCVKSLCLENPTINKCSCGTIDVYVQQIWPWRCLIYIVNMRIFFIPCWDETVDEIWFVRVLCFKEVLWYDGAWHVICILAHYSDVIMGTIASQITSLTIVYSTIYSDADQRKHQSSASLAFVWGIHREPVNSPHKWPVTRKMFPFDDVIMGHVIMSRCRFHLSRLDFTFLLWRTHLPQGKNGCHFADDILKCILANENFVFWVKFHWSLFLVVQLTIIQHGLDNGLAPNRRQSIIWTSADPIHRLIIYTCRNRGRYGRLPQSSHHLHSYNAPWTNFIP